jgi:hypothetical protein
VEIGEAELRLKLSLGLAFYDAAEVYDQIAAIECAKIEAELRAVAVENEPSPAKINWNC